MSKEEGCSCGRCSCDGIIEPERILQKEQAADEVEQQIQAQIDQAAKKKSPFSERDLAALYRGDNLL